MIILTLAINGVGLVVEEALGEVNEYGGASREEGFVGGRGLRGERASREEGLAWRGLRGWVEKRDSRLGRGLRGWEEGFVVGKRSSSGKRSWGGEGFMRPGRAKTGLGGAVSVDPKLKIKNF
ncbi:hypothetical protein L6452_39034 [Arctium lappa]|uniref:Uncharacterized protein n=1 Tax=Arctium lappa TaxID=4217 RepID=A0ACB8XRY4_ARCLA|nr:hypothetical protein L6452_39034 [Arctium lappa]